MKLRVTCCESSRSPIFIFLIDRIHCDAEPLLYFFTFFTFSNPTPPAYTHATLLAYCLLVAYCSRWYPLTIPLRCFSFSTLLPRPHLAFHTYQVGRLKQETCNLSTRYRLQSALVLTLIRDRETQDWAFSDSGLTYNTAKPGRAMFKIIRVKPPNSHSLSSRAGVSFADVDTGLTKADFTEQENDWD